ncbi:hypothetical protein CPLU01_15766 [Colletotrichum plurivorum]|uniref:Uncharacterized protein n=1 Tax=Colletotrichum plurivorum TaxID=2175906 RepID=A0A8H6MTI9_9PEZI|nr:hypothetical protein CPLU01_15766 [Colletotrichum plurivorum]
MGSQPGEATLSLPQDIQRFVADTLARCESIASHGNAILDNLLHLEARLPANLDSLEFRRQLPSHVQAAVVQVLNGLLHPHPRSAPKIRKSCEKWNVDRGALFFYLGHTNSIQFWSAIKRLSDACSSWPDALDRLHHAAHTRRTGLLHGHPGVNYSAPGFLVFDVTQTCQSMGSSASAERQTPNQRLLLGPLPPVPNVTSSTTTPAGSVTASSAFRFSSETRAPVFQEQPSSSAGTSDKTDLRAPSERAQADDQKTETDPPRPETGASTSSVNSDTTQSTALTVRASSRTTSDKPTPVEGEQEQPKGQERMIDPQRPGIDASMASFDTDTTPSTALTVGISSGAVADKATSADQFNSETNMIAASNMSLKAGTQKRPFEDKGTGGKKPKRFPTDGHDGINSIAIYKEPIDPDKLKISLDKIAMALEGVMVVDPQLLDKIAAGEHGLTEKFKDTAKTFSSFILPLRVKQHEWTVSVVTLNGEEPRVQFYDTAASATNAADAKCTITAFLQHLFPSMASNSVILSRGFTPAYGSLSAQDSGIVAFLVVVYRLHGHVPIHVNVSLWRHIMAVLVGDPSDWDGLLSLDRKPQEISGEPERKSDASALEFLAWEREHREWRQSTKEKLKAKATSDMDAAYESLGLILEARDCLSTLWDAANRRLMKRQEHRKQISHPHASKGLPTQASETELERAAAEFDGVLGLLEKKERELRAEARACAEEITQLLLSS